MTNSLNLSTVGVGSGLNDTSLIAALVSVKQAPLTAMQTKQTNIQNASQTISNFSSQLSALQTATQALSDPTQYASYTAGSSDPSIVASASSTASPGSYSVVVTTLAKAQLTYGDPADLEHRRPRQVGHAQHHGRDQHRRRARRGGRLSRDHCLEHHGRRRRRLRRRRLRRNDVSPSGARERHGRRKRRDVRRERVLAGPVERRRTRTRPRRTRPARSTTSRSRAPPTRSRGPFPA